MAGLAYGIAMTLGAGMAFGFFVVCGMLFEGMFWFNLLRRNNPRNVKGTSQ